MSTSSPVAPRVCRSVAWALAAAMGLPACAGSFCPTIECIGGARVQLTPPQGEIFNEGTFIVDLEFDGATASLSCGIVAGAIAGDCDNQLLVVPGGDGWFVTSETFVNAQGGPGIELLAFRRESAEGGAHTFGPEQFAVNVRRLSASLAQGMTTPTYARGGSERCGLCDRDEEGLDLEVQLPLLSP